MRAETLRRPTRTDDSQHSRKPDDQLMVEVWGGSHVVLSPDGQHLAVSHSMGREHPIAVWAVMLTMP